MYKFRDSELDWARFARKTRLYLAYGSSSAALELVALKAAIVLPILLLQKSSRNSKSSPALTGGFPYGLVVI